MSSTATSTAASKNFLANPLKTMGKVTDLPGIGQASAKVLEGLGITSSKQMFGLFLQFDDPDDFIDFLEGKGLKFTANQHNKDPKGELKSVLGEKWDIIKEM